MSPAQLILTIVAASYPVAAAALWWLRSRGHDVPHWFPAGWLATGVIALAALPWLGRPWAWWAVLLALGPWMVLSLVLDLRQGIWLIAALDAAGIAAIAWGLWAAWGMR